MNAADMIAEYAKSLEAEIKRHRMTLLLIAEGVGECQCGERVESGACARCLALADIRRPNPIRPWKQGCGKVDANFVMNKKNHDLQES